MMTQQGAFGVASIDFETLAKCSSSWKCLSPVDVVVDKSHVL